MSNQTKNSGCKRCGRCCTSAIIRLPGIKPNDGTGFAEWLAYHRTDVMTMQDDQSEYLAVRIPTLCMNLNEHQDHTFSCKIYEKRPEICRSYLCNAAKGGE